MFQARKLFAEAVGQVVDLLLQLRVGDLPAGVDEGDLVGATFGRVVRVVGDDAVDPVAGAGVGVDLLLG